jgi:hypothetical protein
VGDRSKLRRRNRWKSGSALTYEVGMVDMTAIGGALASLKVAKDLAEAMIGLRDAQAFQAKAIEFQSAIMDAQNSVFAANEERTALLQEIAGLKEQLARYEAWEAEKARYRLERLEPGVFVYTLKPDMAAGEPAHHICQTCFQRGKKAILHSDEHRNGVHHLSCTECGTKLQVGNWNPPRINYGDQGGGPDSWMGR